MHAQCNVVVPAHVFRGAPSLYYKEVAETALWPSLWVCPAPSAAGVAKPSRKAGRVLSVPRGGFVTGKCTAHEWVRRDVSLVG